MTLDGTHGAAGAPAVGGDRRGSPGAADTIDWVLSDSRRRAGRDCRSGRYADRGDDSPRTSRRPPRRPARTSAAKATQATVSVQTSDADVGGEQRRSPSRWPGSRRRRSTPLDGPHVPRRTVLVRRLQRGGRAVHDRRRTARPSWPRDREGTQRPAYASRRPGGAAAAAATGLRQLERGPAAGFVRRAAAGHRGQPGLSERRGRAWPRGADRAEQRAAGPRARGMPALSQGVSTSSTPGPGSRPTGIARVARSKAASGSADFSRTEPAAGRSAQQVATGTGRSEQRPVHGRGTTLPWYRRREQHDPGCRRRRAGSAAPGGQNPAPAAARPGAEPPSSAAPRRPRPTPWSPRWARRSARAPSSRGSPAGWGGGVRAGATVGTSALDHEGRHQRAEPGAGGVRRE